MSAAPASVVRFYEAIERADPEGVLAELTDDFVGHVTDGLPGIGGSHHGPRAMLAEVWVPAHRTYRVVPRPREHLPVGAGRVIVIGDYHGNPPATGRTFTAAFVHDLRIEDGRIAELRQLTDSHRWVTAAGADAAIATVVRQVFDAVRSRDLDLLLEAYAEDIVIQDDPMLPYGGRHEGREGAVAHAVGFANAWDPWQDEASRNPDEQVMVNGDSATTYWTLRAATGRTTIEQPAVSQFQLRDGKVAHLQMLHADIGALVAFLAEAPAA